MTNFETNETAARIAPLPKLPLFHELAGRKAVVVGTTAAAEWKAELLAAIARMQEPDRTIAKKVHALITAAAPALTPKTWYGMPAYAKDGNVICYFQNAGKFKVRYQTLGFSDKAKIDDGAMWPIQYALSELTASEEAKITALVKKAVR